MDDIIEEILLRLPAKSLGSCKSLSKKWCLFISHNKPFRNRYINRNPEQHMVGIFCSKNRVGNDDPKHVHFLPTSTEGRRSTMLLKKRKRTENNDCPEEIILGGPGLPLFPPDESLTSFGFGHHDQSTHIFGSSNGFLLLSLEQEHPRHYFVCNPINERWVALPTPNTTSSWVTHGFSFHATQHNPCLDIGMHYYQVVRAICPDQRRVFSTSLKIEIFSSELPNPEWKLFNLNAAFSFYLLLATRSTVISQKGVIYFKARLQKQQVNHNGLVFFDQKGKKEYCLEQIEFPPNENDGHTCDCFDLSDELIVYARHHPKLGQLKIWVLNDENNSTREWSLRHKVSFEFTMEKYPEFLNYRIQELFGIEAFHPMNPRVLFLANSVKRFFYDMENSRLELLSDDGAEGRNPHYKIYPYTYGPIGRHLFLESRWK
ncbi:hypothetical protein AQUCO_04100120v1 [Aquilegia coerulea]|uniref:F-box domain-containing protein n=1 Tax=Aquilegia coerulea TaxID=218851 RepID=A0A2G5CQD6_AQUCA|nr:hypothetical protein AQUCO_04100120v1 [Aquilegia coerulea]